MQLIIDRSDSAGVSQLHVIPQRRLLAWAVVGLGVLALFIYSTAYLLAGYWAASGADIISTITRDAVRAESADRKRLWQESIGILEDDIAGLNSRILQLHRQGAVLSDYFGLPGNEMFTAEKIFAGQPPLCEADTTLTPEERQIEISDGLYQQKIFLDEVERKYNALRAQGIRQQILDNTTPIKRPVVGTSWLSSGYGYRKDPFTGRRSFHAGYDYAAKRGTPVIAGADGIVIYTGRLGRYGNTIQLYHGDEISTLYGHLHTIDVTPWQYVKQGETIGTVGSTGRSTGPHLHYEVRIKNRPRPVNKTIRELRKQRNLKQLS